MNHMHPCRQRRLTRGWDAAQLATRMKLLAAREGIVLPKTYLMVRWLFLWENHRASLPAGWTGLLTRILDTPHPADAGGYDRGR